MTLSTNITQAKNLGEQAYDILRHAILTFQLEPGQTIYEKDIAASLNISRTPIRDAIHSLIAEELIHVLPQRTKHIAPISKRKVKENAFVRLSLERSAFQQVAKQWRTESDCQTAEQEIERILSEQKWASKQRDIERFLLADEAFHKQILQLTGNQTLLKVVYLMRGHLDRFRYLAMKEVDSTEQIIAEHEQLFTFLQQQQPERVAALLEQHMSRIDQQFPLLEQSFPDYFVE
ncbi:MULTISPECIES: GntR family transcriptional regulator [Gracilibacillus]|uniref:GntR family transcriptional regulator n=1 Tax=Gracilibacillus TaxID=74385 RepID=UPI000824D155|nr:MULTISPECIES: GntR family transcriptional regulator [Gracilibacillus]